MMRTLVCSTIAALLFLGAAGCARPDRSSRVTIIGSDTMVNLVQSWAEEFMKEHPDYYLAVTGGGSGTGFANLISGTCQVASTSRKIKKREIELAGENGVYPNEYIVGMDGIAVVVHPKNPVDRLTVDQLSDIYAGKITDWKDVGGTPGRIVVLSREVSSGTHIYFKENVLKKGNSKDPTEFAPSVLLLSSSQAIADEVANNPQAVGYYGMGYINAAQKALSVAKAAGAEYYYPDIPNVVSGKYPVSRPLFLYTSCEPAGRVKEFMDFTLSPKGQQIVKETDFVPIRQAP